MMHDEYVIPFPGPQSLHGKRIALVGGAGFIGHHLALELTSRGASVCVVDSLQVNNLVYIASQPQLHNRDLYFEMLHERLNLLAAAGVQLCTVDARDYMKLSQTLDAFKPSVIVQLAAVSHANRSNKDPYTTFDHSLRTLENALDFARAECEHFVYFSSSMVYGNFQSPVTDEEHPLNPIGIYGALKLSGEKIVLAYQQVFGLPYTIVRPAALYGPRCVSRRVSQVFLENALEGKPLRVEGDGSESIPFTYIDDLVAGVCLTIERPEAKNQIFNITFGQARTVNELIDCLRQEFPNVKVERTARDDLRPYRGTMSIDKAREILGYRPTNPLEVGIPKCVAWYRSVQPQVTHVAAA
jgi:nucleoside-diphosphate-sugar epimerase